MGKKAKKSEKFPKMVLISGFPVLISEFFLLDKCHFCFGTLDIGSYMRVVPLSGVLISGLHCIV